jgi:hypothetical protein
VIAFYEHIWNPRWRTAVYGGYASIEHNATAKTFINPAGGVCGGLGNGFAGVTLLAGNSCNPDWSFYEIGTRTQWNPHPTLVIGLDVLFTHLNTAYKGPASVNPGAPQQTVNFLDDQNIVSAAFRWQRNFYP